MTKTVKIWFSTTDEIKEIIAKYSGVTVDKVGLGRDDDGNFFAVVEKELAFPERNDTITFLPGRYIPSPYDYPNPLSPYVTWTADAKWVTNTGTGENITSTGTSISEESIRTSIDDIRAKWTKDDALATSETSKANDWK